MPVTVEEAINQIDSSFTTEGKDYFKSLPEELAIVQFSSHPIIHYWKIWPSLYKDKVELTSLQNDFLTRGASTSGSEISHIIMAAVYRKSNNQSYSIPELYSKYDEQSYKRLIDSLRSFNPGDTICHSWFISKGFGGESYTEIGVVTSGERDTSGIKVQYQIVRISSSVLNIMRVRRLVPTRYFQEVKNRGELVQKVGETRYVESEYLRSWKEEIKILYPPIR